MYPEKFYERIEDLRSRRFSGKYDNLKNSQKYLYKIAQKMSNGNPDNRLARKDIEKRCGNKFDFNNRDNLITDFCYNKVNFGDNPNKFLFSPKVGLFQFVGFDWKSDSIVDVSWQVKIFSLKFTVGKYAFDHFDWNFDELLEYIEKEKIK